MTSPPPSLTVTADEFRRFRLELEERVLQRFRWGAVVGTILAAAVALGGHAAYPENPHVMGCGVLGGAAVAFSGLSTYVPIFARRPSTVVVFLGLVIAGLVGLLSSETGGFASPFFSLLYVVWIFGTAIVPLSPRMFLLATVPETLLAVTAVVVRAPDPGPYALTLMLAAGALGFCYLGDVLRDEDALRSFVNKERLAQTRAELARVNADLERRVEEQVGVIVARARDVDALNAQLQQRVQERSRELAQALARLAMSDEPAPLEPGTVLGDRVVIERRLGEGGMGVVYLGTDRVTGRLAAVKVMHGRGAADAVALQRFVSEAAAAAAISHAGIVRTLHVDVTADGRLYHIMEYVEGQPLDRAMRERFFEPGPAARVGAKIAQAVAAAHASGVIHRDIKPSNVLLTATPPGVRILDFGISKRAGSDWSAQLTAEGELVGTPRYMSPEQMRRSSDVGPATDVYSLGVVVYELVAGQSPFPEATTLPELLLAHTMEAPRPLGDLARGAPQELVALLGRCLAKEPEARPLAGELATELDAIADATGAVRAESLELKARPELAPAAALASTAPAGMGARQAKWTKAS